MANRIEIPALVVHQWLEEWNKVDFSQEHRRKPQPEFFLFSIKASYLRRLSDVYRRQANKPRKMDVATQRQHEPTRSQEINRFIHGGFPWSSLSDRQKQSTEYKDLRMPGWLPTAIVANILPSDARRDGKAIKQSDLIYIKKENKQTARIILPSNFLSKTWNPQVFPLEIIDGQHRLYAIEESEELEGDFEFPVVAFSDLDFTWQAYLFYTINIKPKKINTSLAYDLYPLLRIQDWLERSQDGLLIYRETRAQELTEVLWSHSDSPWKDRINMLGQKGGGDVTQAAFIRSLLVSYVKRRSPSSPIGGLFGDEIHSNKSDVLGWSRIKQAAFLIFVWKCLQKTINSSKSHWAEDLRNTTPPKQLQLNKSTILDSAFAGEYSLLSTDQGVRGVLQITNDMCFVAADNLHLTDWAMTEEFSSDEGMDPEQISLAIQSLRKTSIDIYLQKICAELTKFDWRLSSAPSLEHDDTKRRAQMVFKGSSGYRELRDQLLDLLVESKDIELPNSAKKVKNLLKY